MLALMVASAWKQQWSWCVGGMWLCAVLAMSAMSAMSTVVAQRVVVSEEAQVSEEEAAIAALESRGGARSARVLVQMLEAGGPDARVHRLLAALARVPDRSSIEALTWMTQHRRAEVRQRAYVALAVIDAATVPALVVRGLYDEDVSVRTRVAQLLGRFREPALLEDLFRAFEHGLVEVAPLIGQVGDADDEARFSALLGKVPLHGMLPGYAAFFRRPDVTLAVKERMIQRLGAVSTPAVRRFLVQLRQRGEVDAALHGLLDRTIGRIANE